MENNDKLNFKKTLTVFLVFGGFVLGALLGLGWWNQYRDNMIWEKYQTETQKWIGANQKDLEDLFNNDFKPQSCNVPPNINQTNLPDCADLQKKRAEKISRLITNKLKNYSSTAFVKQVTGESYDVMSLDGNLSKGQYVYTNPEDLRKVFSQELKRSPRLKYFYNFTNLQLVFPVFDKEGKILGAVVRATIE